MDRNAPLLLVNCNLATMTEGSDYGLIEDGAILLEQGRIGWLGPRTHSKHHQAETMDLGGRWVTPGLIDCHTHLVFGGNRAGEFEQRLAGMSYAEIAGEGGGILSTVNATRMLDEQALLQQALPRLRSLARSGVTTVEVKSGYGLDRENEIKLLRAARLLGEQEEARVVTTFLGLHALPREFVGRADQYVEFVIDQILPEVATQSLADAVDAYVEPIAFTVDQVETFFAAARKLGLPVKLHADQLSPSGGAGLAARCNALSADHLEFTDPSDAIAMACAGVVPVLLPGAFLTLGETTLPPINLFRAAGAGMAIATDCNPGTSPLASLPLAMNLACSLFRLTPAEALQGTTRNAARALRLEREIGTLEAGKAADLAVWDIEGPAELSYWMGHSPLHARFIGGRFVLN